MKSTLQNLESYEHPVLLKRFRAKHGRRFGLRDGDAEAIFASLKRFLWFAAHEVRTGRPSPVLLSDMNGLDEMWHEFILRTADYHQFCMEFFGFFLHHHPGDDGSAPSGDFAAFMRSQIERSLEILGDAETRRLYLELPGRFRERKGLYDALFS